MTQSYHDAQIPARWTPDALAKQALLDLKEDWLWTGERATFKETLTDHLGWWARGRLNRKGHTGMYNIIEVNIGLRAKREQAKLQLVAPPAPAPPPTLPALPAAPPVEEAPDLITIDLRLFNPQLVAAYIGRGLGFPAGGILDTLRRKFPDLYPAPIEVEGRVTELYFFGDFARFVMAEPVATY